MLSSCVTEGQGDVDFNWLVSAAWFHDESGMERLEDPAQEENPVNVSGGPEKRTI